VGELSNALSTAMLYLAPVYVFLPFAVGAFLLGLASLRSFARHRRLVLGFSGVLLIVLWGAIAGGAALIWRFLPVVNDVTFPAGAIALLLVGSFGLYLVAAALLLLYPSTIGRRLAGFAPETLRASLTAPQVESGWVLALRCLGLYSGVAALLGAVSFMLASLASWS